MLHINFHSAQPFGRAESCYWCVCPCVCLYVCPQILSVGGPLQDYYSSPLNMGFGDWGIEAHIFGTMLHIIITMPHILAPCRTFSPLFDRFKLFWPLLTVLTVFDHCWPLLTVLTVLTKKNLPILDPSLDELLVRLTWIHHKSFDKKKMSKATCYWPAVRPHTIGQGLGSLPVHCGFFYNDLCLMSLLEITFHNL